MRKLVAAPGAAPPTSTLPPAAVRGDAPTRLVCLALALALVTLGLRIIAIW